MSSEALSLLWRQAEPRGPDRMVMAVLCDLAGYDGLVSVSQRAIASMAAMPKASVAEAINRLIRADHIKMIDAGGGYKSPSVYRLMMRDYAATKGGDFPESIASTKEPRRRLGPNPDEAVLALGPIAPSVETTLADSMIAEAEPVTPVPGPKPPAPAFDITAGHPQNLVGAILTALHVEPAPGDLFWFRQEHKTDAADLARLAGGEQNLIHRLRHAPAAKVPKAFRRLTALAGLVKEGRG